MYFHDNKQPYIATLRRALVGQTLDRRGLHVDF